MKRLFVIIAAAMIALAVSSCSQSLAVRAEKFIEKTEAKCDNYGDEEWAKSIDEYKALATEFSENYDSYSKEEKDKISNALGAYTGILIKHGISTAGLKINEIVDGVSNFLQGILDSLNSGE